MEEIECPRCKHEFEVRTWESGHCPECNNYYSWDEWVAKDYSDSWVILEWESYEPSKPDRRS